MSESPPPAADGAAPAQQPSPLMVGKQFVKQYYQVLSKQPDQIHRFYHQEKTSYLSDATGSNVTDPMTLDVYDIATRWGGEDNSKMIIELENGAIDAQPSVNGSILLVVTGHVSFLGSDEKSAFVHTFFLTTYPNTRRFYVHNDVLRFLSSTSTGASEETPTSTPTNADNKDDAEAPTLDADVAENVPAEETRQLEPVEAAVVAEDGVAGDEEAPGGGVEESKEVAPEEEEETPEAPEPESEEPTGGEALSAVESSGDAGKEEPLVEVSSQSEKATTSATKENGKGGKRNKGRGRSPPQEEPKQQPAAPKPPSSWASLVASGKGAPASTPVPPSPAKPSPTEKPSQETSKPAEKTTKSAQPEKNETANGTGNTTNSNTGGGGGGGGKKHVKRDPDCTLVIKNLPDNTKEGEMRGLFEKFASQTNSKIIGTAVSNHRGLGFVDFDAVAPVLAAVELHSKEPIYLNGRKLDIDQKTAEQQKRNRNRGGYNRSGSPGNNNNRSGGGGRGQYNRRGGGDRGGRMGGGRGSRGGR